MTLSYESVAQSLLKPSKKNPIFQKDVFDVFSQVRMLQMTLPDE
jgi:hypothetical protein